MRSTINESLIGILKTQADTIQAQAEALRHLTAAVPNAALVSASGFPPPVTLDAGIEQAIVRYSFADRAIEGRNRTEALVLAREGKSIPQIIDHIKHGGAPRALDEE